MKKMKLGILFFIFSDDNDVPLAIQMSARAVIQADSAIHKEALEAAAGTWDGEKLEVSKYAENLEQLDNGVKIPPKGNNCQISCSPHANNQFYETRIFVYLLLSIFTR